MFSQPVPSQQVLPFLRCQKAAANHGSEKNPSTSGWQAVFSTSHGIALCNEFCDTVLGFLRSDVLNRWSTLCDSVTDNFRIISPGNFRVLR